MSRLSDQTASAPDLPDYAILRPLGGGRWASVFLATQKSLARSVAIKVLTNPDEDFQARFEREAAVMATVSHPSIVNVIDRGTADGQHFIVMEYLEGGSLRERMIPGQPMAIQSAREMLSAVATGLTTLHALGLIHRDVKPDNVLFDRNGQIKLCDFGISVPIGQVGSITDTDASPGTLDYMAPEQRYRLDVSVQADQFAFAIMAYELLTGVIPPRSYRPASGKNPQLSPAIDAVFERALQEEPDKRYPDIGSLAAELDAALAPPVRDSTPPPQTTGQQNRVILALSAVAIAACCLAGYTVATRDSDAVDSEPRGSVGEENEGQTASVTPGQSEVVHQTGALAFRANADGEVEVLLVRSRSDSHWTIPKANQPTAAPRTQVAEEEAFEEGGIRGEAMAIEIGTYSYKRRDHRYAVAVVPVAAQEELDTWPEDFRVREWHPVAAAAELIASDELRELVAAFSLDSVSQTRPEPDPGQ